VVGLARRGEGVPRMASVVEVQPGTPCWSTAAASARAPTPSVPLAGSASCTGSCGW
jgi:hypothetical protein